MKKGFLKKMLAVGIAVAMTASLAACGGSSSSSSGSSSSGGEVDEAAVAEAASNVGGGNSSLKGQNVRVVIGSTSTSGDSYMMAEIVTRYLGDVMGFNGKVDAVGNAEALDVMQNCDNDGTTVMMFHDMTFLSVLFGAVSDEYKLENMTVGPRIGQNPGACFGANWSKDWNNLSDVTQYMLDNPGETVSFNIEAGAASHLCFVAYYLYILDTYGEEVASQIRAIVGGTTAEKLQRLWDGNADVIYGDTSSFEQYTAADVQDQLRMTMFGSCGEVNGIDIDSMAADGVTFNGEPFEFTKDFCMYFPKDMDPSVLAEYEAAMKEVTENPDFIGEMNDLYYNTLSADEVGVEASTEYIYNKRDLSQELIDRAPSLDDLT